MPTPDPSRGPRMSRGIKLVLMGVAGAALLYSCTPGMGGIPFLWFLPFLRGPAVSTPAAPPPGQAATTTPGTPAQTAPAATQSQRGGFGNTGTTAGSSGGSS